MQDICFFCHFLQRDACTILLYKKELGGGNNVGTMWMEDMADIGVWIGLGLLLSIALLLLVFVIRFMCFAKKCELATKEIQAYVEDVLGDYEEGESEEEKRAVRENKLAKKPASKEAMTPVEQEVLLQEMLGNLFG